jgi:transcriptional regulator with XRE-family HTH domain
MTDFGQRVRELRTAQGISVRAAAGQSGISPAYLSRIESGQTPPPRSNIIKALAEALGVEPSVLFELSPAMDPDIRSLMERSRGTVELLNVIAAHRLTEDQIDRIIMFVRQVIIT